MSIAYSQKSNIVNNSYRNDEIKQNTMESCPTRTEKMLDFGETEKIVSTTIFSTTYLQTNLIPTTVVKNTLLAMRVPENSKDETETGNLKKKSTSLNFYPDPAQDILNVDSESNIEKIEVYNILGKLLLVQNHDDAKIQLDFSGLTKGIYIVSILSNNVKSSFKVLKKIKPLCTLINESNKEDFSIISIIHVLTNNQITVAKTKYPLWDRVFLFNSSHFCCIFLISRSFFRIYIFHKLLSYIGGKHSVAIQSESFSLFFCNFLVKDI